MPRKSRCPRLAVPKSRSEKRSDAECCRTPISQKFLDQDGHIP
jgi:hypothetical protein